MRLPRTVWILALSLGWASAWLASPVAAQTRIGGPITGEMRLTKDKSPYVAYEDVYVTAKGTLIIEPGVALHFKKNIADGHGANKGQLEVLVEGKMVAIGAAGDSIRFTSASDQPDRRDWQGIVVRKGGQLHLENAFVENAISGVSVVQGGDAVLKHVSIFGGYYRGVNVTESKVYMEDVYITGIGNRYGNAVGINAGEGAEIEVFNSFLVGCQNGIMLYNGSYAKIHHSIVSGSVKWGLTIKKSDADVSYCSITNNDYGIVLIAGSAPSIHHNNIFQNGVADVWFRNYKEDVSVDLSNNWWEKDTVAEIQRAVFDGTRDPDVKAFALVEPILTEAVTTDPNVN